MKSRPRAAREHSDSVEEGREVLRFLCDLHLRPRASPTAFSSRLIESAADFLHMDQPDSLGSGSRSCGATVCTQSRRSLCAEKWS